MSIISHFNVSHKHQPLYPQDTPIEENQSSDNTSQEVKTIYKTPKNSSDCFSFTLAIIILIIIDFIMIYIYISTKKPELLFFLVFFVFLLGIFLFCLFLITFYYEIIIDPVKGIIKNKIRKLSCCFYKTKIYKINEIKMIIIDIDENIKHFIKGISYNSFKLEFLTQNNKVETIFSGIIDKNNESQNVFNIFKNELPNINHLNKIQYF